MTGSSAFAEDDDALAFVVDTPRTTTNGAAVALLMEKQRYHQARNITCLGALFNLLLAIIKILFGWLGRSHALVADGIHSFSDLLTDALVLLASRFGSRQADWDHPYGHERIETAAALFLALILNLAGVAIIWNAVEHLLHGTTEHPHIYVLLIAFISVVANEFLFHITLRVGKKIQSKLLLANAWHHRSDAASSVVVLVGVAGSLLGYSYLDALAAVIVGLMIIRMGAELGWSSVKELVDTSVPEHMLETIKSVILSVPGVKALHQLRTRSMADNILVDAHILVDPRLSVSEGHYIASKAHEALLARIDKVRDVTIHVDPENDEYYPVNLGLPPRQEVLAQLTAQWLNCPGVDYVCNVRLHYLGGKIEVELNLPWLVLDGDVDKSQVQKDYNEAAIRLPYIKSVDIAFF